MPQIDGHAARIEAARTLAQRIEAQRMARHVVVIDEIVADQHVHQPERERSVGSRQQGDVLVAFLGGERAIGSMAMSVAPRRFASWARAQKCTLEVMALQPQKMMSLASSADFDVDADARPQA